MYFCQCSGSAHHAAARYFSGKRCNFTCAVGDCFCDITWALITGREVFSKPAIPLTNGAAADVPVTLP